MAKRDGSEDWHESDLVSKTRTGRPIEPRNVNRAFESRCATAGVKVIRVHDTRHTCGKLLAALDIHPRVAMQILRHVHATTLLLAGVPVLVVAARLGHADPAITLRVYAHVVNEQLAEAAAIFAERVDGAA